MMGVAHAQSPQMQGQLLSLSQSMAAGQAPASAVFGGFSSENVENPFMLPLELGRCYTFLGTVGAGVGQLSLYLFDPLGKTIVKDTQDKSISPHVTWCTKIPGMYKVIAKIKRGRGEFAVQAFTPGGGPPIAAQGQQYATVQPPPQQAPPPQYAPPPPQYPPPQAQNPLAGQLFGLAGQFAPGQAPATPVFGGMGYPNQENPFMAQLDAGRCYTFIGTVGPGVQQLSLYLFDPMGKTIAKDTSDKSVTPHVNWCATFPGSYKIIAKIKKNQAGAFAVQGFAPMAAPPPQ
jgi:hypothetical protein